MKRPLPLLIAFCGLYFLLLIAAPQAGEQKLPPITTAALSQGALPAPWGWRDFCRKNPADCVLQKTEAKDSFTLTPEKWKTILETNVKVNQSIEPVSDTDHWGKPESWDYPSDGKGDCEDYAILKRGLLIRAGIPASALLMTVVINRKGEGHAVLTLKSDRGDFVLDNVINEILAWESSGYRFVQRQSETDPNEWVRLGNGIGEVLVAARDKKSPFD
jgi:predicted transglutaminase-like cysteine proteinase